MKQLTGLRSWSALGARAEQVRFSGPRRSEKALICAASGIEIDFSRQQVDQETLGLLVDLATEQELSDRIRDLFQGAPINQSERIPALHTALRILSDAGLQIQNQAIMPLIREAREQLRAVSTQIRTGEWVGYSGKAIRDVIHIGIGGSDSGPRVCMHALLDFYSTDIRFHFISNSDPTLFGHTVRNLNPETTLFILASKSFTTQETCYNASRAQDWIGPSKRWKQHFIAVTANIEKAHQAGIQHVIPIWPWIGGRYSLTSAMNLITCIATGFDCFSELLEGAEAMDQHFQTAELHENLPVLLALTGVWNINFLHIPTLLMLTYADRLDPLVPFFQQLDMESNGKSIDVHGRAVNYATGPIVWGGSGNAAQHSYFQLLCQGTHKVAVDLILTNAFSGELINRMGLEKARILNTGVNPPHNPNGYIPGGTPVNVIRLRDISPRVLGSLVALYEHKVFTQAMIWNINPFDQPGVESAKQAACYQEI